MKCKDVQQRLIFYLEKSLRENEMIEISGHLKTCSSCREILAVISESYDIMASQKELSPSSFLYTRIQSKLHTEVAVNSVTTKYIKVFQPIMVSFIILISVYCGIKLGDIYKKTVNTELAGTEMYYWDDMGQEQIENTLLLEKN
jgi:predicted anti-sigma-YlaC factor YlaD